MDRTDPVRGATIRRSAGRLRSALALPPLRVWRYLAFEALWSLPLALLLCAAGGLATPGWTEDGNQLLRLAIVALIAPALGEELLFRVLLLPRPDEPAAPRRVLMSITLFVLWHPPQALLFGSQWAAVVLNPAFLVAVAVMGLALARLYRRTGSVWPCVLLHWSAVVGWKAFFGAPSPWIAG